MIPRCRQQGLLVREASRSYVTSVYVGSLCSPRGYGSDQVYLSGRDKLSRVSRGVCSKIFLGSLWPQLYIGTVD